MANRSFKRVLSETSLERKCRFLFGACLLLLITASFWFYGQRTEILVRKQNEINGSVYIEQIMLMHHFDILFVKPRRTDVGGMDASDSVALLAGNLARQDYSWSLLGSPGSKGIIPSEVREHEIIQEFLSNPEAMSAGHDDPEQDEYHYYQAARADQECIQCHTGLPFPSWMDEDKQQIAEGDLLGIVKVTMPTEAILKELYLNRAILGATAIITVFLAVVAAWFIVRLVIVKPLKHLRDVSDAISRGDIDMRANLQTADEFEELGVAFNRMLRHLVAVQQELREVNGDLDSKVDELAQANMQLFEMNRLKSDFLATMSHELRTPLNSIIGFSDVLGSIDSLDDKQSRYVDNIQKSGRVLLDMINEVLDLAKLESGKMEVRLSSFRVEHVIAAQCDMSRPLSERKNIDLDAVVAPGLPELRQDQAKVQQILNNLLSNAIKFTPEGGRIVVEARRDGAGELEMTVTDTGVGIADEEQIHIFEKFRQGASVLTGGDAMTRQYTGTGLGLSIVKELCRLLGGEITLKSELGKGSAFTVRLPWILTDQPRLETLLDGGRLASDRFVHRAPDGVSPSGAPVAPAVK